MDVTLFEWLEEWKIPVICVSCVAASAAALALLRWWLQGPSYTKKNRMDGKVVAITGANTGIGKETAMELAKRGARIIMLCRDLKKAQVVAEEIFLATKSDVGVFKLDLSSLESIRTTAQTLRNHEPLIHVLINNAGVMMCPRWETKDGFETQFGTNHLGHFLLTLLLLDNIKAASPSRIITISSIAHTQGKIQWDDLQYQANYHPKEAYCQSKLANILFTRHLAKLLAGSGVTTYALHPGVVQTELGRHLEQSVNKCIHWAFHFFGKFFFKTVIKGAQTSIYCAVDEKLIDQSGKYYSDCKEKKPHSNALNDEDAERLWEISTRLVGLGQHSV